MGSVKIKDVKLVYDRGFAFKAHFENGSLQKCRKGSTRLLSSVPHPEITGTIA